MIKHQLLECTSHIDQYLVVVTIVCITLLRPAVFLSPARIIHLHAVAFLNNFTAEVCLLQLLGMVPLLGCRRPLDLEGMFSLLFH